MGKDLTITAFWQEKGRFLVRNPQPDNCSPV